MLKYTFLFIILVNCASAFSQTKPNFLWLVIEDTSPQFIGCYGNANAKTPNIDSLAKEGVRFTNAFSTGTVCSPSRSAIITGARTFEMGTGNHRSQFPLPDYIKGFPTYLREVGYYTSNNSKTDYNTSSEKKIVKESWNENSNTAGWGNRKPGQPFFSVFNFGDCHQSRTMTNPYDVYVTQVLSDLPKELQIGDNDFEVPPRFRNSPEMRHQLARIFNGIALADYKMGKVIAKMKKENLWDSTIVFFYADHGQGMPGGKTNGIDLGFRVPFVVRFPEMYKHLSPLGKAGIVTDDLVNLADLGPTLLEMSGVAVPSYMHGRNILESNIAPKEMLLTSDGSEGVLNVTRTITTGNLSYTRIFLPFLPQMYFQKYFDFADILRTMRNDFASNSLSTKQQQIFQVGNAEFLFDIKSDPWQTNNLARKPKYKKYIESMRKALQDSIIKNKDVMFLPSFELQQISKTTTPYEFRLNTESYPISKIYSAAKLGAERNANSITKKMQLLRNSNKIIRYWAALALKANTAKQLSSYKASLISMLNKEEYEPTKIALASVCSEAFGNLREANVLLENILKENHAPYLKQFVLQMLTYQKNKADFVPVVQKILEFKNLDAGVRENAEVFLYVTIGMSLNYNSFW